MVCSMSRPNFRFVEDTTPKVDMDELIKDYLNPNISVDDILKKHHISKNEYLRLRPQLVEKTGESRKPSYHGGKSTIKDVAKHITQDPLSKKYRVQKTINGVLKHFGRYETLEEAMRVRNVLMDMNWDREFYLKHIKPHYFKKFPHLNKSEVMSEFEEDYLSGMFGKDLMEKYGLSPYRYANLSISIKHKYGLSRKPQKVRA